jgi:4-hydroxy-tetrahydrodipicolinate synthase
MRGVFTALVTPFQPDGRVDMDAFKRLLKDQATAGVDGVIPCGTTGESPTLSHEEKKTLIRTAIDELKGTRVQVIAGTGSNDTAETVELSQWASAAGAAGVLVVTPYYNKPSQAGLEAHFRAVADAVHCEVMLYNVPGRTGVSLAAETIVRLAEHPRIRSLKEATGNIAFTSEILDKLTLARRSLALFSGDDATYLPFLAVGGSGVVSVASNLFPRAMVALQKAVDEDRLGDARALHARFYPLFRDLFVESNPVPVKAALELLGFCGSHVRAPLVTLSETSKATLVRAMNQCGFTLSTNPSEPLL